MGYLFLPPSIPMRPQDAFEHVVVGSGPAGCSVALELLRSGAAPGSVLLLERRGSIAYGRYHEMCAGGISRVGTESLGLDVRGMVRNVINGAEEHWPGDIILKGEANGYIIDRNLLLDQLKAEIAHRGGAIRTDHVIGARESEHGIVLSCASGMDIQAVLAYGADGSRSVLRRDLFGWQPQLQILAEQHLVPRRGAEDKLVFYFTSRTAPKYQLVFPCGDGSHVGFPAGSMPPPPDSLLRIVRPIPVGPLQHISRDHACLVGDAACQSNPLTFGGIRNGMEAGRMAARAALEGHLQKYGQRWAASPLADPCFLAAFEILSRLADEEREVEMAPLRGDGGIMPIMRSLMMDEKFRVLYRAHVRKLHNGW